MTKGFLAIIGAIIGAIVIWFKSGGGKQKKFWKDVTDLIAANQKKEEELNKPIEEAKKDLEGVDLELENIEDAKLAAAEAVRLLRKRHGWDTPTDESG